MTSEIGSGCVKKRVQPDLFAMPRPIVPVRQWFSEIWAWDETRVSRPDRGDERLYADDGDHALQVVGQNTEGHRQLGIFRLAASAMD